MIKAVFFDVGATLLTPKLDEGIVFSQILKQHDVLLDASIISPHIPSMYDYYEMLYEQDDSFWSDDVRAQNIWIEMYEFLCAKLNVDSSIRPSVAEDVYRYYFSSEAWKTFDDVIPTLDELKERGLRMALISNWDSTLSHIIEGLGLSHYFETILASAVVELHKPMPQIFELALERMQLAPYEALHVGDHVTADAWGAKQVGIHPVLLDRLRYHTDYEGTRIQSLAEIAELLSEPLPELLRC